MSCERFQKNIPIFLKSSLSKVEEDEVFNHLNVCLDCRIFYQDVRQKMLEESGNNSSPGPK